MTFFITKTILLILLVTYISMFTINPIYATLCLIVVLCLTAVLMITLGCDFFALIIVIVYVGAIAILFLFIIMMLDLKVADRITINFFESGLELFVVVLFFTLSFVIFILIIPITVHDYLDFNLLHGLDYRIIVNYYDSHFNIILFGHLIYTYFSNCLLFSGLILLIAMVGSITVGSSNNEFLFVDNFFKIDGSESAITIIRLESKNVGNVY